MLTYVNIMPKYLTDLLRTLLATYDSAPTYKTLLGQLLYPQFVICLQGTGCPKHKNNSKRPILTDSVN